MALLLGLGWNVPAAAQDFGIPPNTLRLAPLPDHARLLVGEVGRPVTVLLVDGTRVSGRVGPPEAGNFVLEIGENASLMEARAAIAWPRIQQVQVHRRHGLWQGIALGVGVGALAGSLAPRQGVPYQTYGGITAPTPIWEGAFQGALIGAAAGLLRGLDVVLRLESPGMGTVATGMGTRPVTTPSIRVVHTSPATTLTFAELRDSLAGAPGLADRQPDLQVGRTWNSRAGVGLAWEMSWPLDRWWLRTRTSFSRMPRIGWQAGPDPGVGPSPGDINQHYWREYQGWSTQVGLVLPIGPVRRLPLAELSILTGVERVQLRTGARYEQIGDPDGSWQRTVRQHEVRPVMTAGASLAVVRRPALALALRGEASIGPGFRTNPLADPSGALVLERYRITPTGVWLGFEALFPRF